MIHKSTLTICLALFLLDLCLGVPVDDQNQDLPQPQETQPQTIAETESTPSDKTVLVENKEPDDSELPPPPDTLPPQTAEEKSDLDTANTFWGGWGGYYRRPYYGWGGYGGWRRGWGGYGYGRGFGWGGYGGWGWGGNKYYWG